ncbi:hypothetical protein [uncultured Parabacteroides sp.]|uniref:hypothetical protein n=1 Tax=uncultured Parabacteroides sp. TaxID=512312 RepID=UPI0026276B93|nr:hypothetical protein [uncultured Parabacteroides sp.]
MNKRQEKKTWSSQLAIENPANDRIAIIYSVRVDNVRVIEKTRNSRKDKLR